MTMPKHEVKPYSMCGTCKGNTLRLFSCREVCKGTGKLYEMDEPPIRPEPEPPTMTERAADFSHAIKSHGLSTRGRHFWLEHDMRKRKNSWDKRLPFDTVDGFEYSDFAFACVMELSEAAIDHARPEPKLPKEMFEMTDGGKWVRRVRDEDGEVIHVEWPHPR